MPTRRPLRVAALVAAWAALKALSLWAFVYGPNEYSDTYYFWLEVEEFRRTGSLAEVFPEYPTPAAWLLLLPGQLGPDDGWDSYRLLFVLGVTLVDAAFVALLIARTSTLGVLGWITFTTLSARLAVLRLDLLPAVLAAAALLLVLLGRPTRAGPLLALGAAVKLWPALLFPLLMGEKGRRGRPLVAFVATGLAAVAASVAWAGWGRLFTPLTWQGERGLQIEAIVATPAMVWRLTDGQHHVQYSRFNAYEVYGPRVGDLLGVADAAALVALAVFVGLLVLWFRRGCPAASVAPLALYGIVAFIATSKAFSPQYLLWSGALATVWFGLAWRDGDRAAVVRPTIAYAWTLVLMALTVVIYPAVYDDLLRGAQGPTALLIVRNVLLVAYGLWLAVASASRPAGSAARPSLARAGVTRRG